MYTKRLTQFSLAFVLATLFAGVASAQDRIESKPNRGLKSPEQADFGSIASGQSMVVSKTAYIQGPDICGQIRIFNFSGFPANVVGIVDWLEVHFPNNVPPPGLVTGSDLNWFKVADLAVALPLPIAPFATLNINYCHPLCETADHPRADYMRNVVRVSISMPNGQARTFPARSGNVRPPVLDCRACCLPDGSCSNLIPVRCTSAGGLLQGTGTDCATTECPQACCHPDDTCSDDPPSECLAAGGETKGPGTNCASTQCCTPLGSGDCAADSDCCNDNAFCQISGALSTCCILSDESGCNLDSDCCVEGQTCEAGTCCAPLRVADTCQSSGDCCTPLGKCLNGECCISPNFTGCNLDSDCCVEGQTCEAGTCCAPLRVADTCQSSGDCCTPLGKCLNGECCITTNFTGCNLDSDCCTEGQTCVAGVCCRGLFASCNDSLKCCSGLECTGGICDQVISP